MEVDVVLAAESPVVDVEVENRVITKVVEKEVEKRKFGASVDTFLGDVDENGNYVKPTGVGSVNFSGVKVIPDGACTGIFYGNTIIGSFSANDVVDVGTSGFENAFYFAHYLKSVYVDNLETVNKTKAFYYFCYGARSIKTASFKKLKEIHAANAFESAFQNAGFFGENLGAFATDEIFPSLEAVSGSSPLKNLFDFTKNKNLWFSKIKRITGATQNYSATFGYFYVKDVKWYFPSATEFTGLIWNVGATYGGEIHFAVANQAAIEACDRYADKWGFAGATIYFDLMLNITVNGIVYSRKHTIDGYTSWEDTDGNIVYTDATAEPAVDTPVYSDAGTTQVGTVSEVA